MTICALTFGEYPRLAKRCLGSILRYCDRSQFRLVVGANAAGRETLQYLTRLRRQGDIDRLIVSPVNLYKNPMMSRMFRGIRTEFIWWFDDDSYITDASALPERLRIASESDDSTVMWGRKDRCDHPCAFWRGDPVRFVRSAPWYRGLPPPSWKPGGKGEFNFKGRRKGDGQWWFAAGGGWFARTRALRELNWPDPRLMVRGEDVFLGEAIRQRGWKLQGIDPLGMAINTAPRRW